MNSRWTTPAAVRLLLLCLGLLATQAVAGGDGNWPSFRGPRASGVAEGHATPVTWDVGSGKNVLWRTPLPGLGFSSPVVWGDRVFVTTAISGKADPELKVGLYGNIAPVTDDTIHRYRVYCLDRRTGRVLWEHTAHAGVPRTKRHFKSSHANPSPATDGKRLVVSFGSEGLYAYDLEGRLLWKKDLGLLESSYYVVPDAQWGFGSSPIIHDGRVIVLADVMKGSFLAALDAATGEEIWRTAREDVPTWGTPTIYETEQGARIAVNGYREMAGYDLATGKRVWNMNGRGDIPVPTPVVADGTIFISQNHKGRGIYAIRTSARGDISLADGATANAHVAWNTSRNASYMQTPLVYRGLLYVCRDNGVLACYRPETGEEIYQQRLGDGSTGFTASAVAADGKLYYTSEMGDVFVVRAGEGFELLGQGALDEVAMATPAISEGVLLFRTRGHVVAVGSAAAKPLPAGESAAAPEPPTDR